MDYRNLSPMQLDALKEVFNIGSANAATSLSLLLNRKIDMGVPNIKIIRLEEILEGLLKELCNINSINSPFCMISW